MKNEIHTIREALEEAIRRAKGVHGYSCIDKIKEALAAIDPVLGTELARAMHDLDPKVSDCVQKNFSELIEPAREES